MPPPLEKCSARSTVNGNSPTLLRPAPATVSASTAGTGAHSGSSNAARRTSGRSTPDGSRSASTNSPSALRHHCSVNAP